MYLHTRNIFEMSTPQKESDVGQVTNIAPVSLKNVGRRSTLTLSRQNIVVQGKFLIGGYVKKHYLSWSGWQKKLI